MSGRFHKQTGYYADSPAGFGARQRLSMHVSRRRYHARQRGELPPVEYRPLSEVVGALG